MLDNYNKIEAKNLFQFHFKLTYKPNFTIAKSTATSIQIKIILILLFSSIFVFPFFFPVFISFHISEILWEEINLKNNIFKVEIEVEMCLCPCPTHYLWWMMGDLLFERNISELYCKRKLPVRVSIYFYFVKLSRLNMPITESYSPLLRRQIHGDSNFSLKLHNVQWLF